MGKKKTEKFYNPELRLTKEEEADRKKLVRKLDKALATGLRKKKRGSRVLGFAESSLQQTRL
jgi:hypothetical protein